MKTTKHSIPGRGNADLNNHYDARDGYIPHILFRLIYVKNQPSGELS